MKSPLNHHQSPQKQVEKASQTPASIAASLLHSVGSGKHRVPGGWGGGWSNVSHHPNIGDCSSPDTCGIYTKPGVSIPKYGKYGI